MKILYASREFLNRLADKYLIGLLIIFFALRTHAAQDMEAQVVLILVGALVINFNQKRQNPVPFVPDPVISDDITKAGRDA